MNPPRVSVIMPLCDGERFVREALGSIRAQNGSVHEVIVVDDGSTDGSVEIVTALQVPHLTLFSQENRGPASARNRALRHATGDLVAFLDADDTWLPNKLAAQVPLFESAEVDVVLGRTEGISSEEVALQQRAFRSFWESRHFLQLGAMMFRRSLFSVVGMFDETLRFGEDIDWCIRAQEHGVAIHTHDETVLLYRRHRGNMTNDISGRDGGFLRVLKKSIDRKRACRAPRDVNEG